MRCDSRSRRSATDRPLRAARPRRCASTRRLCGASRVELGHVDLVAANTIGRGAFVAPDESRHELPAFCRVQGEARPTRDSQIRFELWMPANGWNGRYYQLGSGGFGGTIPYAPMAGELRRGNAVAATDTVMRAMRSMPPGRSAIPRKSSTMAGAR